MAISGSFVFKNLTHLDISHNNLGENGAHILSVTSVMT